MFKPISKQNGFTLIELMIVVAIIGILAMIALPAYKDYLIRSRITEGLNLVSSAKMLVVTEGSTAMAGLKVIADSWNAQNGGPGTGLGATSKYVNNICITNPGGAVNCGGAVSLTDPNSGVITITYNEATVGLPLLSNQIQLHPYVRTGVIPTPTLYGYMSGGGNSGAIDWACVSATNETAAARFGVGNAPAALGAVGVPQSYVPAECR